MVPNRGRERHPHAGSRTCLETRIATPAVEDAEEIPTPTRRFTVWETTSGLPDDSWQEDERLEGRRSRIPRGCVERAGTIMDSTSGPAGSPARESGPRRSSRDTETRNASSAQPGRR